MQGFRDGLLKTLTKIQDNQFEITWQKLIYDQFAARRFTKKNVYVRQRALALALPMDRSITENEIQYLSADLTRTYANLSSRTLRRDLDELVAMNIVVAVEGRFRANTILLRKQVPQRRPTAVKFGGA